MQDDTSVGGHRFPSTHLSAVVAVSSENPAVRAEGYKHIIEAYWKPAYKYIRVKWHRSNEDAKDLTQGFFTRVMEKEFFKSYDPAKSRFRTFLRVCVDRFVANEDKAADRIKRGGDVQLVPLDFDGADQELAFAETSPESSIEEYFNKEWVRHMFGMAVDRLESRLGSTGKTLHFQIFQLYNLDSEAGAQAPTYEEIARRFNISVSNVTNHLASTRREFRKIVLEELRKVTVTDQEFREEARELLGIDPP